MLNQPIHTKDYSMKNFNQIILGSAFVAAIALSTSCKKDTEPGPAGATGKNAIDLRYKQEGTTLKLSGIYSSDGSAFDNTYKLSYYSTLDENSVVEETVELENPALRTSETATGYLYHIVRRDSLNNSVLSFDIAFYAGADEPVVENLNFDIITNITSAGYKRIATGYVQDVAISGNTANGYFRQDYLDSYTLEYDNDNNLVISNWDYNTTTRKLSFDFSGTLIDRRNSTRNELTVEAKVSADLNHETHRKGKE